MKYTIIDVIQFVSIVEPIGLAIGILIYSHNNNHPIFIIGTIYSILQILMLLTPLHEFIHYKCAQLLNPQSEPYIISYSRFDCKNKQVLSKKQIQIIAIAGSLGQIIVFTFIFIIITIIINTLGIDIVSWYQIVTLIVINLTYAAQYIPTDKTSIPTDGYWILHPEEWKDFKIPDTEK